MLKENALRPPKARALQLVGSWRSTRKIYYSNLKDTCSVQAKTLRVHSCVLVQRGTERKFEQTFCSGRGCAFAKSPCNVTDDHEYNIYSFDPKNQDEKVIPRIFRNIKCLKVVNTCVSHDQQCEAAMWGSVRISAGPPNGNGANILPTIVYLLLVQK